MTDISDNETFVYFFTILQFFFCSRNSYEQQEGDVLNKRKGEDSRRRFKAFNVTGLLSRTSKDNSPNYGDFSEEIDVILLTGHRLFVGGSTHWDVTDKGGNRSKEQMRRYFNCRTYIRASSKPLVPVFVFVFTQRNSRILYSFMPKTSSQLFSLYETFIPCNCNI